MMMVVVVVMMAALSSCCLCWDDRDTHIWQRGSRAVAVLAWFDALEQSINGFLSLRLLLLFFPPLPKHPFSFIVGITPSIHSSISSLALALCFFFFFFFFFLSSSPASDTSSAFIMHFISFAVSLLPFISFGAATLVPGDVGDDIMSWILDGCDELCSPYTDNSDSQSSFLEALCGQCATMTGTPSTPTCESSLLISSNNFG